jgi:hypothetical protein
MVKSARNYMIWQVSYFIYVLIFRFALHALIHFGVLLSFSFFLMTQCFCLIQSCCCDSLWFLLILNLTCSFYASLFATLLLCFYFSCLQLCIPLAYKIIIFLSLYFWCRLCSFVSLVVVFFFLFILGIVFRPGYVQGPGFEFWPGHQVAWVNLKKKKSKQRCFSKKQNQRVATGFCRVAESTRRVGY